MNGSVQTWLGRGIAFADLMVRGMEFGIVRGGVLSYDLAPIIPLGQDPPLLGEGWPDLAQLPAGEYAGTRLMNDMDGTMPDGRVTPYVVVWDGTGSCRLAGPPVAGEQNRTSNRVEVRIDPTVSGGNAQLAMFIGESDSGDPVRNVRVWLPGKGATKPLLWEPYLEKVEAMNLGLGPYTWRCLDWTRVNEYGRGVGNHLFEFDLAGMIKPDSPIHGTRRGMCPEFMVAFCNETQTNLHFQVPHRTDDMSEDDYLTFLIETFVRIRDGYPAVPGINGNQPFEGLDENLQLTIELSNEIWNDGFAVYYWMNREATRKGISFEAQIASQVEIVFDVADAVFSEPGSPILRKYVGAFVANPGFVSTILNHLPPGMHVDSIGPAAYFSPKPSVIQGWLVDSNPDTGYCPNCPTVEEVIEASRNRIDDLRPLVGMHRTICDNWENPDDGSPLDLEIYEGGQGIVAGFQPWVAEANAAQIHPLMYDAYVLDYIPMLIDNGVDVINWFCFTGDQAPIGGGGVGPFGYWNDMDQTISLPVPDPYVDEGAPKVAAVYRGPPLKQ